MKILIVGGGIAGLYLAAYLRKHGIQPVVIEREKEFSTIGYVLGIMPNGLRMLREVGLDTALIAQGKRVSGVWLKDKRGKKLAYADFKKLEKDFGPTVEIERDLLHKMLESINLDSIIRMGVTIKDLKNHKDGVDVTLSDSTKDTFDLVVGADGIGSQVRQQVRKGDAKDYAGFDIILAWIPPSINFPKTVSYYSGDGTVFAVFPTRKNKRACVLFFAKEPPKKLLDVKDVPSYLKEKFSDFGDIVPEVLKYLDHTNIQMYKNDDNEIHLKQWYKKRVVLLGDAAHATSLIMGEGASMAMEDAYVLTKELLGRNTIDEALYAYQQRRYNRVHKLARYSWIGHEVFKTSGTLARIRNMLYKPVLIRFVRYYEALSQHMP